MQEKLEKFNDLLEHELGAELDKIGNAGTITPENICTVKDAMKIRKLIREEMGEGSSYGYSNRRGRSPMTGRYVSRDEASRNSFGSYDGRGSYGSYQDGYSGHDEIMNDLGRMMSKAKSPQERQMIEEWMRHAERA